MLLGFVVACESRPLDLSHPSLFARTFAQIPFSFMCPEGRQGGGEWHDERHASTTRTRERDRLKAIGGTVSVNYNFLALHLTEDRGKKCFRV